MLRPNSFLVLLLLLLLSSVNTMTQAQEASVTGQWKATAEGEDGDQTYSLTLEGSNNELSGSILDPDANTHKLEDLKFSGKDLSFSFDPGEGFVVTAELELKDGKLVGTWMAKEGDSEVGSGGVTATRIMPFAGTYNTLAILPDGTELKNRLTLKGKNDSLSGWVGEDDARTKLDKVSVEDNAMRAELKLEVEGAERDIAIQAKQEKSGVLEGRWILLTDAGEEEASGDWSATSTASATIALFDGSSLDHFRGYKDEKIGKGWSVDNGEIAFAGKGGDLMTKEQFDNFELTFEWQMTEGGNSGVMYRVTNDEKKPYLTGPEYQLLDDDVHRDGKNPLTSAGSIYALYAPENKSLKPIGEWNSSKIVLNGAKLEHWLNGKKVAESEIGGDDWNKRVSESKFKTWKRFGTNDKGHICFQDHGNPFRLRNINIKKLK